MPGASPPEVYSGEVSEGGDRAGAISLVRGDAAFRLMRRIGLIPADGLGVGRRAAALALLAWLPIALWALIQRRAISGALDEPLLQHFGVSVSCLVAIPLFVLAEALVHARLAQLLPHFLSSGLVSQSDRARYLAIVAGIARLRDGTLPWVAILGVAVTWSLAGSAGAGAHQLQWALEPGELSATLRFGGLWFVYVARPIYLILALGWLWRLVLLFLLLRRVAGLELSLVPTHPDRAGGLGFLDELPPAFALVPLALACVLASLWAHEVVYHGLHVSTLRLPAAAFLALAALLFLSPYLAFAGPLRRAKRRALLEYGGLVGLHGRLVRQRWVLGETVADTAILSAPELGPIADTAAIYESAARMRGLPIGMRAVLGLLAPSLLPLLAVFAIEIPVGELAGKLLKVLL